MTSEAMYYEMAPPGFLSYVEHNYSITRSNPSAYTLYSLNNSDRNNVFGYNMTFYGRKDGWIYKSGVWIKQEGAPDTLGMFHPLALTNTKHRPNSLNQINSINHYNNHGLFYLGDSPEDNDYPAGVLNISELLEYEPLIDFDKWILTRYPKYKHKAAARALLRNQIYKFNGASWVPLTLRIEDKEFLSAHAASIDDEINKRRKMSLIRGMPSSSTTMASRSGGRRKTHKQPLKHRRRRSTLKRSRR